MIRVGKIVLGQLNVAAGDFTYGNRIALGDIFQNEELSEYRKMASAFKEIYGYSCRLLPLRRRVRVLTAIVRDFAAWCNNEQTLLKYDPTPDELAAGINDLSKKVGSMATVHAIARKYAKDPDEILKWEYSKVFGILYTDLENTKYEQRLNKVINAKYNTRRSK